MKSLKTLSLLFLTVSTWAATCTVERGSNGGDDVPAIRRAFLKCGQGGTVVFLNETYNIETVMNITGLNDCVVELYGTLLVSDLILFSLSKAINSEFSLLWFECLFDLSLVYLVEYKYDVLAQQSHANWISEPVCFILFWW